jgi:hypothetical protein
MVSGVLTCGLPFSIGSNSTLPPPPAHTPPTPPDSASGLPLPTRDEIETAIYDRQMAFFSLMSTSTFYPQQLGGGGSLSQFGPDLNQTIYVDTETIGRMVPASFIGISREYTNESVYWDRNLEAYGALLDVLGPSPVIRLGGASQEALTAPPTAEYMRSLVTLHCALGVRYIIGLPLFQNSPALALTIKQAYDKAFANFPRAVLSYELGNEVGLVDMLGLIWYCTLV